MTGIRPRTCASPSAGIPGPSIRRSTRLHDATGPKENAGYPRWTACVFFYEGYCSAIGLDEFTGSFCMPCTRTRKLVLQQAMQGSQ